MVKKPIVEITEQDFDRVFCANAKGTFFTMQEAARRIINIGTSLLGSVTPNYSIYDVPSGVDPAARRRRE